jgi:DASH complex subunit DAM1
MSTSTTPRTSRTPLRRLSHGSLAGLSRSTTQHDAPSGLGYLDTTIPDLAVEAETMLTNVERLHELAHSLAVFNESFASFLYILKMDACCVEWPEAPTDESFALVRRADCGLYSWRPKMHAGELTLDDRSCKKARRT